MTDNAIDSFEINRRHDGYRNTELNHLHFHNGELRYQAVERRHYQFVCPTATSAQPTSSNYGRLRQELPVRSCCKGQCYDRFSAGNTVRGVPDSWAHAHDPNTSLQFWSSCDENVKKT